jgi:aquaporin related protein
MLMVGRFTNTKADFVAFLGEFVGTTMFLFFAFSGTQVANVGSEANPTSNTTTGESAGFDPNVLLYISVVFAFSLMVNVWVFFRISGGLFNPAVTLGLLLTKSISSIRAGLLLTAQITGSIFASFLVSVLFPTNFNVRTTLGEGTSLAQGVFIETILTAELVFTIFMLAKEKHKGNSLSFPPPTQLYNDAILTYLNSNIHCPRRHRPRALYRRTRRRLLHRWLSQPRTLLWSLRGNRCL